MALKTLELNLETKGFDEKINDTISKIKEFSESIQKSIEEASKKINNTMDKIADKIQSIADSINKTDFGDITIGILGFVSALIPFFTDISNWNTFITNLGVAFGAIGTSLMSSLPIILGVGAAIAGIILLIQNLDTVMAFLSETFGETIGTMSGLFTTFWEYLFKPIWDNLVEAIDWIWTEHLQPLLSNMADFINELIICINPIIDFIVTVLGPIFAQVFNFVVNIVGTAVAFIADIINNLITIFKRIVQFITGIFSGDFTKAWDGIINIFKGFMDIFKSIFKAVYNIVVDILNLLIKGVAAIFSGIGNIIVKVLNAIINFFRPVINSIIDSLNLMPGVSIGKFTFVIDKVPDFAQMIPSIPKLDVGTNYVPSDQLAMIHQGEAVIPKKFNSSEYFGKGNDETNSLLKTLISRVDAIEINPYTTIKDVGNASVKYINNESRIRGGMVINI